MPQNNLSRLNCSWNGMYLVIFDKFLKYINFVISLFPFSIPKFLESYASTFRSKVTSYLHDTWNILDIATILLFVLGMILRLAPGPSSELLNAARVVLSINIITFFSRILHIFSISKQLGPKLSMIYQMVKIILHFNIVFHS